MPYIQQVIDKTHELGMTFEMHSCGYIQPTIPYLVDMGIDAIQPLQYCNDVAAIKKMHLVIKSCSTAVLTHRVFWNVRVQQKKKSAPKYAEQLILWLPGEISVLQFRS